MEERLQKIIARAGITSRRRAEEMIASGLVTVNGQTVTEMGTKADETRDHIKVAGKLLRPDSERVYLLLNKPPEVVSTLSDPEGRPSLRDLLHGISERVFPVGRLEYHSYGLVFLTNDGDLANQMLKAHHLQQTYHLKLKTLLTFEEIESLGRSTGARITRIRGMDAPWYVVSLSEARRDALRNRLFQTGHPVEKIKRVGIANLELGSLAPGSHRALSGGELVGLKAALAGKQPAVAAAHEMPRAKSAQRKFIPRRPVERKFVPRNPEVQDSEFDSNDGRSDPRQFADRKAPWQRAPWGKSSPPPPGRDVSARSAGASHMREGIRKGPWGKPETRHGAPSDSAVRKVPYQTSEVSKGPWRKPDARRDGSGARDGAQRNPGERKGPWRKPEFRQSGPNDSVVGKAPYKAGVSKGPWRKPAPRYKGAGATGTRDDTQRASGERKGPLRKPDFPRDDSKNPGRRTDFSPGNGPRKGPWKRPDSRTNDSRPSNLSDRGNRGGFPHKQGRPDSRPPRNPNRRQFGHSRPSRPQSPTN